MNSFFCFDKIQSYDVSNNLFKEDLMSLVPWKTTNLIPFKRNRIDDELTEFQQEMNTLMRNFFKGGDIGGPVMFDTRFYPSVDVKEKDDKYLVYADMPGVNEKDIDIDFHNNVLTIKGERKSESEIKDAGFVCVERSSGSFRRDIPFDDQIDQEKIIANLKNGVLQIELLKMEKSKASHRKIEIKN